MSHFLHLALQGKLPDTGIFGAPSFLVGDELFCGDDRLEQAIKWAGRG